MPILAFHAVVLEIGFKRIINILRLPPGNLISHESCKASGNMSLPSRSDRSSSVGP